VTCDVHHATIILPATPPPVALPSLNVTHRTIACDGDGKGDVKGAGREEEGREREWER